MLAALVLCVWSGAAAADDCTAIGAVVGGECQVSQFVTASGTLTIARPLHILGTGQIKVPAAATGQPPSSLSLNVTGTLTLDAPLPALPGGGAIVGDVQDAGAIGATLTIVASGDIALAGDPTRGASITSNANPTDCAGNGRAGKISVTSTGGGLVAGINTQITANAQCPGGEVTINVPSSNISIDGSVSAASGYSGFGNLTISKGGPVTIAAGCQLTLGPDSSVRSSGVKYGADRVHLESGCDTLIQGEVRSEGGITYPAPLLNETLPNKCVEGARTNKATSFPTNFVPSVWQPTGCIEVWSGGKITIQSKSTGALIAESGNAAGGLDGLCCTWIDVFAKSDIAVAGPGPVGSPSFYALNARQYAGNAPGGLVTVKSVNGKVTATGGGFITAGGRAVTTIGGGTVWIEAGGPTSLPPNSTTGDPASNVDLNATWVQGIAAVASPPGTIRIRSYNGDITGTVGGRLDSRTTVGGSVALTIQGCRLPEYFVDWNATQIFPQTINLAPVCGGFPTLPPPAALPKRPVLVTMVGGTFPWDNLPHAATGTVQDAVTGAVITTPPLTITYVNATTGAPLVGLPINPGVYTAVGSFPGDLNYAAASGSARVEIFVGVVSVSVTGNTCVYSGDPCPASASATIDTAPRTPTVTYNGSTTVPVNAGTYNVVATLAGLTATATVTITPLTPPITFTGDGTFVFDASAHKVTATVKGAKGVVLATLSYGAANTTAFGYTPAIGALAGPFNVCVTGCVNGGYQVTASYPGLSPNYLSATAQTAVIITKATPTVFVGSFTLVFGQSYSYNLTNAYVRGVGTPQEDLGVPTLVYKDASGKVLPGAPTLPGVYTVVGTYMGTNTNYVPSSGAGAVVVTGSGIVTITPLIATISLPSPVYVYNGSPQGVTATVAGSGIAGGTLATVAYLGTTSPSTAPTNVAVYPTQATFTLPGYVANPVSGTITITPATPTFTLTGGTFAYNGQPRVATPSAVSGVGGQVLAAPTITYCPGIVTTPCATPLATAPIDAGTYTAFAVAGGGANYTTVTKTATITITKATATITLTGGPFPYDGNPHPAVGTLTATGLPAGTLPDIAYTPAVGPSGPVNLGVYAATASVPQALASNYTATPATATVTITGPLATITVTGGTFVYDGLPHPAIGTLTATGIPPGTPPDITYTLNGAATGTPVQVGVYTATASLPAAYAGSYTATPATATVTITPKPGATLTCPTGHDEPCIVLDFREITYFNGSKVITSSDARIRSKNGIAGAFNPSLWPYSPTGGSGKTPSRGTLFRIYGFKAEELGFAVPDVDVAGKTFKVKEDTQISGPGRFYIELNEPGGPIGGHPARVWICPSQLQTNLIDKPPARTCGGGDDNHQEGGNNGAAQGAASDGSPSSAKSEGYEGDDEREKRDTECEDPATRPPDEGIFPNTGELTDTQRNVPGIMLTHNASAMTVPRPIREELQEAGLRLESPPGTPTTRGAVEYIAVQQHGGGTAQFREFVNVVVTFPDDDDKDRTRHYTVGFHTAKSSDSEDKRSFGCDYLDFDAGNKSIRLTDHWDGTHRDDRDWGRACGSHEPPENQMKREDNDVPFDTAQILSTVSTGDDTTRLLYCAVRPLPMAGPRCADAEDHGNLWPPDDKFERIEVKGVTHPRGRPVTTKITGIYQDEPSETGTSSGDAYGVGTSTAWVRRTRKGLHGSSSDDVGDGRRYTIDFEAKDDEGNSCKGTIHTGVPHDKDQDELPRDSGRRHDSSRSGVPDVDDAPSKGSCSIPSSSEGGIKLKAGDWVSGGYSFKTNFNASDKVKITAKVVISGTCTGGTKSSDTVTIDLGTRTYTVPAGATDWRPTGDASDVGSWHGALKIPATACGGGQLDASKGAVLVASVAKSQAGQVTFRFKYRNPAADGKPNTNCLDTGDPNRARSDVCGASWSKSVNTDH